MESIHQDLNLEYCRASTGKRMANYLIDGIIFYIIIFFWGMVVETLLPGTVTEMELDPITERIIGVFLYGLVMFGIEGAFQGKSLGKLITKTKAVDREGGTLTFKQLLIRNFTRAVPFNALSAFSSPCSPWHDTWSNTLVVDENKVSLAQRKEDFYNDLKNHERSI